MNIKNNCSLNSEIEQSGHNSDDILTPGLEDTKPENYGGGKFQVRSADWGEIGTSGVDEGTPGLQEQGLPVTIIPGASMTMWTCINDGFPRGTGC